MEKPNLSTFRKQYFNENTAVEFFNNAAIQWNIENPNDQITISEKYKIFLEWKINLIKEIQNANGNQLYKIAKLINFNLPKNYVVYNCLCCEKEIKLDFNNQFDKQEYNYTSTHGSYGSYLDMTNYEYIICNDCIKAKYDKGIIKEGKYDYSKYLI